MRVEHYHREKPLNVAWNKVDRYWSSVADNPHEHRVGDTIILGTFVIAILLVSPIWVPVGIAQMTWFYTQCKVTRWRATRSGKK